MFSMDVVVTIQAHQVLIFGTSARSSVLRLSLALAHNQYHSFLSSIAFELVTLERARGRSHDSHAAKDAVGDKLITWVVL